MDHGGLYGPELDMIHAKTPVPKCKLNNSFQVVHNMLKSQIFEIFDCRNLNILVFYHDRSEQFSKSKPKKNGALGNR